MTLARWPAWLALAGLMLVGHFVFFVGYTVSDDSLYLTQARHFLQGDFSLPTTHWGFRYTVVLPVMLLGVFADYSERLLALVPLSYWLALLAYTWWFVTRAAGQREALFTGLLVATLPLFVVQSSILGVDIAEAFFLFACFGTFYFADSAPRPNWRLYFMTGLLLGLAMLTRETAYGFPLVLGVFFLLGGYRRWTYYLVGLAGVLTILSLECTYYLASDEAVLYRLETITQSHGGVGIRSGDFSAGSGNISDNRIVGPLLAVLVNQEFALLYWAAAGATLYLWRHGELEQRQLLRYVGITFAVYFLWIGYGGAIRPLPRYFSFLSVLAMIPIALMLVRLQGRLIRGLLLTALLGSNFAALSVENIHPRFASRTVSDYAMVNDERVFSDKQTATRARGYLAFAKSKPNRVSSQLPASGEFVYASVDGRGESKSLTDELRHADQLNIAHPPKLLIGHLLDLTHLAGLLPESLYRYLAIRNPTVQFYRVPRPH